ncbi:hypothetical protein D3C87_1653890 [compost metagenome]
MCQRQADHRQRAIGFDIEQTLDQRTGTGLGHAAVDHQDLRQAVAVLAKVGDEDRLAVLRLAVTEAGRVEGLDRFAGLR